MTEMGRPTGLEPATLGTTNRCSNQLSYGRHARILRGRHIVAARPKRQGIDRSANPLVKLLNQFARRLGR